MDNLQILLIKDAEIWRETVKSSESYDFYHLPSYHDLAEERGEGVANLYVYREGKYMIALPLLVRPIQTIPGLEKRGKDLWDATSVYGYAGPVSAPGPIPESVIKNFHNSLKQTLLEKKFVSVFSRLHPFVPQSDILNGLGMITVTGVTVAIDLTLPLDEQKRQYAKGHKSGLNKLKEMKVECYHDEKMEYLDQFIEIYYETMHRVNAEKYYYFSKAYFEKLINELDAEAHHFMCTLGSKIICGGLYIKCNDIIQAHLGGTRNEFIYIAPRKLEKDSVRIWATQQGARVFHLGGGVGAKRDSLYEFKAGFSKTRKDFRVWKWIVNPELYLQLCQELDQSQDYQRFSNDMYDSSFFPSYRNSMNI